MKKFIYILLALVIALWVGYRIHSIYTESSRQVFNVARIAEKPVLTMIALSESGVLKEPLFVKNNRAFVSGARVKKFGVGQRVGNGHIISVSNKLDLDTGMYEIKTKGTDDGEHFAEAKYTGFFIPLYAVEDDKVMLVQHGKATLCDVKILGADARNVLISRGLQDGDVVILSKVKEGEKVDNR